MTNTTNIIAHTEHWVKEQLMTEKTGHDWQHIRRVTKQAQEIAEVEGADNLIVTLAALTHDLIDDKVVESTEQGITTLNQWFNQYDLPESKQNHIMTIISTMSFKGGNNTAMTTIEGMIVQDADRLDALGAIGIARTFIYSGSKGQPMYDPTLPIRDQMTFEEYRHGRSSAINHFHEKLLKLKEQMNTEEGKRIATVRHAFMETFLEQFYEEWGKE